MKYLLLASNIFGLCAWLAYVAMYLIALRDGAYVLAVGNPPKNLVRSYDYWYAPEGWLYLTEYYIEPVVLLVGLAVIVAGIVTVMLKVKL